MDISEEIYAARPTSAVRSMDARICKLRVVAFFLVVLLHTAGPIDVSGSSGWTVANLYESFSRVCVPIFLMVSGATLLTKSEPLGHFVSKRLLRIVPALVFWSLFYLGWLYYNGVKTGDWVVAILDGPVMYHLWYLYAILGFYTFIPMLRRFYQGATNAEKIWAASLWFLLGSFLPSVTTSLNVAGTYGVAGYATIAGYIFLGAVAMDIAPPRWILAIGYIGTSLVTAILTAIISRHGVSQRFYEYMAPAVVLGSLSLFLLIKGEERREPGRLLRTLSDCMLGAYCLHVVIIGGFFPMIGLTVTRGNDAYTIPIFSAIAGALSIAVIWTFRKTRLGRLVT